MRRRFVALSLLGCFAGSCVLLPSVTAQTQPRSVVDYFNLLTWLGIGYPTTQQNKRELLQTENHPVIDVRHDYLLVHPDSSPAEQLAVFRARGKADLLAVSLPDSETDYNNFVLFQLRNGKLQDVTRQVLPMSPQISRYLYELPQFGTIIRVFRFNIDTQTRSHVFDLQWRKGRFVKVQQKVQ